ncbi:DUF3142 domain-containing protein [Accumulibacter sp.]|uniref:DUF3142 domain-containing protein n=1 Tax=Accumulibacter sp. TaxID=2053492 RepID=UPI002635E9D6|nr:DUF3142 domain-containing protein [Accumulibacter sp.]
MSARWLPVAWLAAVCLAACGEKPAPMPLAHDAYVWQRRWQPALSAALRDSADLVGSWRILAGEVDRQGRFQPIAVDRVAIVASGRPAIPVVRIAAPLATADDATLIADLVALRGDWPTSTTLEIDHDCGSRQLADYTRFLVALRRALPPGQRLSLTVLPDWLSAPELDDLLATVDEAVLQLHSLDKPARRLFDAAGARAWTASLARRTDKPFRVALPNYGSRVVLDGQGRIAAVESEVPLAAGQVGEGPGEGRELFVAPTTVAAFLRWLEKASPRHLAGVVWFRLPLAGDQRAWTPATWRAVVTHRETAVRLTGELQPGDRPGQQVVVLHNAGAMDGTLPAALIVKAPCRGMAGRNGYVLEREGDDSVFLRSQPALLRAGGEVIVGLAECPSGSGGVRIDE